MRLLLQAPCWAPKSAVLFSLEGTAAKARPQPCCSLAHSAHGRERRARAVIASCPAGACVACTPKTIHPHPGTKRMCIRPWHGCHALAIGPQPTQDRGPLRCCVRTPLPQGVLGNKQTAAGVAAMQPAGWQNSRQACSQMLARQERKAGALCQAGPQWLRAARRGVSRGKNQCQCIEPGPGEQAPGGGGRGGGTAQNLEALTKRGRPSR